MSASTMQRLGSLVKQVAGPTKWSIDVGTWAQNVEILAARAGLLVSGDVCAGVHAMIQGYCEALQVAPLKTVIKDLLAFSNSAAYAQLRVDVGLSLHAHRHYVA